MLAHSRESDTVYHTGMMIFQTLKALYCLAIFHTLKHVWVDTSHYIYSALMYKDT
jgi:hypothetical protein